MSRLGRRARTYQALGEGVDVAEGLEAGEVRPDPGDGDADWESGRAGACELTHSGTDGSMLRRMVAWLPAAQGGRRRRRRTVGVGGLLGVERCDGLDAAGLARADQPSWKQSQDQFNCSVT